MGETNVIKRATIILCLLLPLAALGDWDGWGGSPVRRQAAGGAAPATPYLYFGIANCTTCTAPVITAATLTDADVTWIPPTGTNFYGKNPVQSLFTNVPGQYSLYVSDWSAVTKLSFAQNADRAFMTSIVNDVTMPLQTAMTQISFQNNTSNVPSYATLALSPSLTNLYYAFADYLGTVLPPMTNCPNMVYLYCAYDLANKITAFPEHPYSRYADSIYQGFARCDQVLAAPIMTNYPNITVGDYAFNHNGKQTNSGDWSTCTNLRSMVGTFSAANAIVGLPDAFNANMPRVTTYHDAFVSSVMTGTIANWTWHTNITDFDSYKSHLWYTNVPACLAANIRTNGFTMRMDDSYMPTSDVSQVCIDLDTSGVSTNLAPGATFSLNIGGTTAGRSNNTANAAGWQSVTNLRNKGWTITVNNP